MVLFCQVPKEFEVELLKIVFFCLLFVAPQRTFFELFVARKSNIAPKLSDLLEFFSLTNYSNFCK
jgi:hypothetical protein